MNRKEFNAHVARLGDAVSNIDRAQMLVEPIHELCGRRIKNAFEYSAICEMMFKRYLESVGKQKKWTWYGDLSIGEWCEPIDSGAVLSTCKHALKYWADNEKCMAEFACSVAMKSTEHYERGNLLWAQYYSGLYDAILSLLYDYYEGDKEKTFYLWEYLD